MIHTVKTWPLYFEMAQKGTKPFEIRKNDRDYKVGDIFISKEYDNNSSEYTGREMRGSICSISTFEQKESIVVLGIIWNDDGEKLKYSDEAVNRLIRAFAYASDCTMCTACGHCDVTDRFGKNRKVKFQRCCEWISKILIEWSEQK